MKLIAALVATIVLLVVGAYVVVQMNEEDPAPQPAPAASSPQSSPSPSASPSPSPPKVGNCSAAELAGTHDHTMADGLPAEVATTRMAIIEAAIACDYKQLEDLALLGSDGFSYSFGVEDGPAAFWRAREREAKRFDEETSEYMRYLVATLQLPYCEEDGPDDRHYYVWPRVHCSARTDEDWNDLEGLYPDEQIEQMRTGDSFLGFRIGILEGGDWVYFIAGD